MADKIYSRIVTTHDTEAFWNERKQFVPYKGEQIIYDPDETHNYSRVKIGDGVTTLFDLPFSFESSFKELLNMTEGVCYVDGGHITEYALQREE